MTKGRPQRQEKGTEVDVRAELYSKQGNTDFTELTVLDVMTQCEACKEHNLKGKSSCTQKVLIIKLHSTIAEKHQHIEGCADRYNEDGHCCKCIQENNRTYETMISRDKVASGPHKIHKITPQQRQARFGNQWHLLQTTAGGSNTIPSRQHPELGQAHCARMEV